jgi:hypothetical protein
LCFPSFQTLDPPPTPIDPDDHEAGMQYLIYDPRSRCWLTERGDWSANLLHARRFLDYHAAAALRVTLPSAFALYVTEGHAPDQP